MNCNLFVYGTLLKPEIQKKFFGKILEGKEDSVVGFKKSIIVIEGESYSILEKSRNRFDVVFGKVFEITDEDLKKLDEYETDAYRRVEVVLSNGEDAWVYVK